MIDFYLITGFLGAGKTTFLKNFAALFKKKRIHLIINEFGKEGVDGALVAELAATLAEINNGSVFCSCRLDKFEEELTKVIAQKPEVVITEASGLADPTNVKKVLGGFPRINYKGTICIVDAVRLEKVYSTAVVCRRQLAISSLVLINKCDVADKEQLIKTENLVKQTAPAATLKHTQYGKMSQEWLGALSPLIDADEVLCSPDITLQKATLTISENMSLAAFERCLTYLCEECYRIKGFVKLSEGLFFADCTGPDVQIKPWSGTVNNKIVLLAGKGMNMRKAIKTTLEWYPEYVSIEE